MEKKDILQPFHEWLSSLDYFQDLTDQNLDAQNILETDMPIHRLSSEIIQSVPLRFSSQQHYCNLWLKLFYDQVKSQIIRSISEQPKQPELVQILQVDNFSNHFKLLSLKKLNKKTPNNLSGLVLLSPIKPTKGQIYPCILGFVQNSQNLKIKAPINEKIKQQNPQKWQLMISTKTWYIQQICSISTLQRQYYALHTLSKINPHLRELILHPDQHNKQIQKKFKIPLQLDHKLKSVYNQSQYKAINECLKQTGITMIQGPPGTGKTKTVLGTLSILLSSFKKNQQEQETPLLLSWKKSEEIIQQSKLHNPWLYADYKDWRDEPLLQDDCLDFLNLTEFYVKCDKTDKQIVINKKSEGIQLPGKVLICGPSNASVDQIIRKLINQNLLDKHGEPYLPSFVRIGQNYDASLKQFSLQFLAEKLCQKERGTDLNQYRSRILTQFRLVFGTLSSVGSNIIKNSNVKFDTVVIDQAGQSIQISNLIPLIYKCQRLILIGDPNQLPATVFSSKSLEHRYDQSLFQRLMKCKFPVSILKTQYRMHPQVSEVIGKNFYGQSLQNWDGLMIQQPKSLPKSFIIFHVDDSYELNYKKSFRNQKQAQVVKDVAYFLSKHYGDVGIISPYSQQINLINSMIGSKKIEVKTIDSFQGRQKQVIIFSAVRARNILRHKKIQENKRKTIGFVSDIRRINVSLSRAKSVCIIVADIKRLCINQTWKTIINDAVDREQVFEFSNKKNFLGSLSKNYKDHLIKQIL